jgi:hypothetical protein
MPIDSKYDSGVIRNYTAITTIHQYHYVVLNATPTANTVTEGSSEGGAVFGIALETVVGTTNAPKQVDVFVGPGFCKVQAGAIVTLHAVLQSDADGECIDAGSGDYITGYSVQASTAADDFIETWFCGPSIAKTA